MNYCVAFTRKYNGILHFGEPPFWTLFLITFCVSTFNNNYRTFFFLLFGPLEMGWPVNGVLAPIRPHFLQFWKNANDEFMKYRTNEKENKTSNCPNHLSVEAKPDNFLLSNQRMLSNLRLPNSNS